MALKKSTSIGLILLCAFKVYAEQVSQQKDTSCYDKKHLSELEMVTKNSTDPGFSVWLHHAKKVDQIMGYDYAERHVTNIIMKDDSNVIAANSKSTRGLKEIGKIGGVTYYARKDKDVKEPEPPDWEEMYSTIKANFGGFYAKRVVGFTSLNYYKTRQEWPEYAHRLVGYYTTFPYDLQVAKLNEYAWAVFQYSDEKKELKVALKWAKKMIADSGKSDWQSMDTYANLLYKLNHKSEALDEENLALSLAPGKSKKAVMAVLDKMKKDEKTWP